jgi:hypothetical protein
MNVSLKQSAGLDAYLNLGEIVADLRKLRAASQKRRYREGRLPELPSREAMTLIVDGLAAALYPRHFGPSELTVDCTTATCSIHSRRPCVPCRSRCGESSISTTPDLISLPTSMGRNRSKS